MNLCEIFRINSPVVSVRKVNLCEIFRINSLVVSVRKVNLCEVLNQLTCVVSEEGEFMRSFESTHLCCQ